MFLKPNSYKSIKGIVLIGILNLLTSCGNSVALESLISPDPKLIEQHEQELSELSQSKQGKDSRDILVSSNPKNQTKQPNDSPQKITEPKKASPSTSDKALGLPPNIPNTLPVYPQAQLQESKIGNNKTSGMLIWNSKDNQKAIAEYYETELAANDWKVIKPFTFGSKQQFARAIAVKAEVRIDLTLVNADSSNKQDQQTKLSIIYQPIDQKVAKSSISQTINLPETNKNKDINKEKSQTNGDVQVFNSSGVDFDDLDQVSEQLRQPLELVAALDILTPYTENNNVELSRFAPNQVITRGEYARWLVAANNRYFADDSGKKIYLVTDTSQPAFQDVKPNNSDFKAIQSLAEVGLVPSRLTEDSTNLLFKPNSPLKREDLLTWKVPLDMRQALPQASIEAIKESWGFQDAADIESSATRALYADYQNGDRSNVRRIFGYTTLFQPKKPVTRAEAAASLWYFGFQGDGITAKEILKSESDK